MAKFETDLKCFPVLIVNKFGEISMKNTASLPGTKSTKNSVCETICPTNCLLLQVRTFDV